jgi:hypothetical protein
MIMKDIITLSHPITINGKQVSELPYDIMEITNDQFDAAEAKAAFCAIKNGGSRAVAELDNLLHKYLGYAAITAANPKIDVSDLERIKGPDIMKVVRAGRNFLNASAGAVMVDSSETDESPAKPSDGQCETTQEPSM